MPLGGAVIGAGGAIGGALIGSAAANKQAAQAQADREAAVKQWLAITVPDPAQQAIELEHYKTAGTLSPKLETAFQQSQSGLKNLQVAPESRAAEVQALQQMQKLSTGGGLDAQAIQQETQAENAANANEQGQRGAIVQNMAERGIGGSGAELAAKLQASQGDANQAAAGGQAAASAAQQRALQSMTASSQMGANLNAQDYGQAAKAAEAQDTINRFNTQNQQGVANSNVSSQNQAQAANLAAQQATMNANTGVTNQQEIHNKGLAQQNFENQAQVAGGVSSAYTGSAAQHNTNATNEANQWAGIGNAISQAGTAYGQYANNQANADKSSEKSAEDYYSD